MVSRVPGLGFLGSLVLLLAPAVVGAAAPRVFREAGIVVRAPAGWYVTSERLNGITEPVQRFVLSSYRVPVGADAGNGYVPPSGAVLAQLVEEAPAVHSNPRAWPARPSRFILPRLGRMETLDGNHWGELLFREHGRHFYVFIWVGRHATSTQVGLLLRALDGIRITTP
jgi:hypothetical protein